MRRPPLLAPAVLAAALALAGCSSGSGEDASERSTSSTSSSSSTSTTTASTTTTTVATTAPPTTAVPAPSVLPPVPGRPGDPSSVGACTLLGDILPLADLVPRDGVSWPDERMRVVADTRRSSVVYGEARTVAPTEVRGPLAALAAYTAWAADQVQDAPSASEARARLDAYPAGAEVAVAADDVDLWQSANCA